MWVRFLPLAALVVVILAVVYYSQTSRGDTELKVPLAEPGTFTRIEEAQRAAGFRIPTVRDPKGWNLANIEVMGNGLYFPQCEGRPDCDPVGRMVILEYKPQAEGPTLTVRVLRSSPSAVAVLPVVRPQTVEVPLGKALLGEDNHNGGPRTDLHFRWIQDDVVISAKASLLSDPARATFSKDEFLAMMRSIR